MIYGKVNARLEAIVRLRARGPGGVELNFDAIIDTGFNSFLTLPLTVVRSLGLIWYSRGSAVLGDGSLDYFEVYVAEVEWDGNWRSVLVSAVGDEVLVGMELLTGHDLKIAVAPGGAIEIRPLS